MAEYYAHTAELPDGKPDPDRNRWQLLSTHLRNVAGLAKQFAAPPCFHPLCLERGDGRVRCRIQPN